MTPVKVHCYENIVELLIGWSLHSWSCKCQIEDDRAVRIKSHDLFMSFCPHNSAVTYNMVIVIVLLCNGVASDQNLIKCQMFILNEWMKWLWVSMGNKASC